MHSSSNPKTNLSKKFLLKCLAGGLSIALILSAFPFKNYFSPVNAQSGVCTGEFQSVGIPLTELGTAEYIRMDGLNTGFSGGLYPDGSNQRPPAHEIAGRNIARTIVPLNGSGSPDPENGKIVMLSIGMSNTNAEYDTFSKNVEEDSQLHPRLLLINGALGGQTSDKWIDPNAISWQELSNTLERYQVSAQQVQVAWIKETQTRGGDFPAKAQALQADLEQILKNLKAAYPNVKIAYFSSRIYSYTYWRGLSPEPNAYETGFAVKWLIEKQINGDPELNFDPQNGPVTVPYLSWGPYLWADGQNPREDSLVWLPEDLTFDCTHPTESGRQKVAGMLLDFFKTDTTTRIWFMENFTENSDIYLPLVTHIAQPLPGASVFAR
jgi:hypothetical protein